MEALAKVTALYLRVMGWFFAAFMAGMLCLSVVMVFDHSHAPKKHVEDSPTWYLRQ